VLRLSGVLMFVAALAVWWVKTEVATAQGASMENVDGQ